MRHVCEFGGKVEASCGKPAVDFVIVYSNSPIAATEKQMWLCAEHYDMYQWALGQIREAGGV
jgi:hypothetical protein